ncbi:MAG: PH domain-containing protein [Rhodanobacteraceae bacterium]|nr:PH domain-containing protein [Rhodanobacteraceae bacterium]
MASVATETPLLLDARLRFPVHALPDERVVWAGTAVGVAYIAAMMRVMVGIGLIVLVLTMPLWGMAIGGDDRCRVPVDSEGKAARYRDCTAQERVEDIEFRRTLWRKAIHLGAGGFGVVAIGSGLALLLRRRHLVYVVTNERVVVQDGYLGIRLDTIDLDHVVSITAKADWIDRWCRIKSVSVTVPGQKAAILPRGAMLANAIELWGLPENDPALSQLLNVWLPRSRG